MFISKLVPLVTTNDLDTVKDFYLQHFGFRLTFEGAGYLGLRAPGTGAELSFMRPTCPGEVPFAGKGLTLVLEVADVDAEHERLRAEGVAIVQPPRDNPWGDRNVLVQDPVGVFLYICQPLPIAPEYQGFVRE